MTDTVDDESSELFEATASADPEESASTSDQPIDAYHVLKERYLTLVESTLAGTIYEDDPLPVSGADKYDANLREYGWDWPSKAFTMIGLRRLRNFRAVIESVIGTNVPGDIMEAGVWRGGAGIMARAVLAAYGVGDRRIVLADSFAGLPPPNSSSYPADADSDFHKYAELAVPLDEVKRNFAKFGLLDEQVVFLPGWFKESLPTAPVEQIAVLRLDCDMYESTIQALDNLYDKVSINGWIVIDDFEVVPACRAAVHDFLKARNLQPEIYPIDGVGVFFRKADQPFDTQRSAVHQRYEPVRAPSFTPVNVDFVAWREALMAVVRASEAVVLANESAKLALQEAAVARHEAIVAKHEAAVASHEATVAMQETTAAKHAATVAMQETTTARQETTTARHEATVARQEATVTQHEVTVARQEVARVRLELADVYASRSWRLSRPYRALGDALRRLRGGV